GLPGGADRHRQLRRSGRLFPDPGRARGLPPAARAREHQRRGGQSPFSRRGGDGRGGMLSARERLIVALDVPTPAEATTLVDRLAGLAGMFKVGSQLFTAGGPDLVRALVARGEKVFLDLKYHDIPNTVAAAVSAACRLGVSLVDVHALGGKAMMEAAVGAMPAMGTRLLAVTVLTSHDAASLGEVGVGGDVADAVRRLALLAHAAEVDGVVASPQEVALIREACGADLLVVTPGIRAARRGLLQLHLLRGERAEAGPAQPHRRMARERAGGAARRGAGREPGPPARLRALRPRATVARACLRPPGRAHPARVRGVRPP